MTYMHDGEISFSRGLTNKEMERINAHFEGLVPDIYSWSEDHSNLQLFYGVLYSDATSLISTITDIVKTSDQLTAEGFVEFDDEDGNTRLVLIDNGYDYEYLSGDDLAIRNADSKTLLNELLRRNNDNDEAFRILSLAADIAV